MALLFNEVNKKGSYTWTRCNDDAKANFFRNSFVSKHGGIFNKTGRDWEWGPSAEQLIALDPSICEPANSENIDIAQEKSWSFVDESGVILTTTNIQEFCKQHNLTRSSLYEVIAGRRKTHKGYSLVK